MIDIDLNKKDLDLLIYAIDIINSNGYMTSEDEESLDGLKVYFESYIEEMQSNGYESWE